jgi:hypothetical protein
MRTILEWVPIMLLATLVAYLSYGFVSGGWFYGITG